MDSRKIARGLGWFGIALGVAEVIAPRKVAKVSGLQRHARTVQLFGLREIASGALILAAGDPLPWLWTRVAGDGLDGALLTRAVAAGPNRLRALGAFLAVAPVVALDMLYAPKPKAG